MSLIKKKNSMKGTKNKILFETSTIIDKDEFKKFQRFYLNKVQSSLLPKLIMAILAVLAIVLNAIKGNFYIVGMVVVFIIIYPIVLSITLNRQIDKMYESDKKINMLEEKLFFYDQYFESKSGVNYGKINYDEILMVCETKRNFYIFIGDREAFIIIKDNLNNTDKFKKFMMRKTKFKRYI